MLLIDRDKDYIIEDFTFKNYFKLSIEEKREVLKMRNDISVRNMMTNSDIISERDHFDFIEKLSKNDKNFYWTVNKKDQIIGAVYINKYDLESKEAFWGFFLNPELMGMGYGKKMLTATLKLFFEELGLKKIKAEVLKDNVKSLTLHYQFNFKVVKENSNNYELLLKI
ncbi:UDP-4-amino-4,6-dideoxy-N-acetyl-beta-L-altrosamine N-acetyltransferase [Flavobacteriaceae bacterium UJ101]|nr:UDP-4-amino-4,6-dideoxy-N-acetyl-beta-L-altrosamine N-acetyltransferase [Flavobacteriaceae bacterium UJ101]